MGNTANTFRKALVRGNEAKALKVYHANPRFSKRLDPSAAYGRKYQHNTPLHYACRYAMTRLLRIFLLSKDVDPNKRNDFNQTCLHMLCQGPENVQPLPGLDESQGAEQRRAECLQLLLFSGVDLFVEDTDRWTACDHAAALHHHTELAIILEIEMVFPPSSVRQSNTDESKLRQREEPYEGLIVQDLRRMKDALIQQTADMLGAPRFTSEVLLGAHDWDMDNALEAWLREAAACCQRTGVTMPTPPPSGHNASDTLPSPSTSRTPGSPLALTVTSPIAPREEDQPMCEICMSSISVHEDPVDTSCGHKFCRVCWEGFLNGKIQEGDVLNIRCPAYECFQLVPGHVIESVVSGEMNQRYLQFDIKAFVQQNPSIRWCPAAGCEWAVRLTKPRLLPCPAVICGKGHLFCWECLGEPHEPCDCQTWTDWLEAARDPEEVEDVSKVYQNAASRLWMLNNCRQCAKCRTPIERKYGCNYMRCRKCRHEFCWVCMDAWSKHRFSPFTGQYDCNRYAVIRKREWQASQMVLKVEGPVREIEIFLQYHKHYKKHAQSYEGEKTLLETSREKMEQLSKALVCREGTPPDTHFLEDGVCELLKARCVLKSSYPYVFYLRNKDQALKERFESAQRDLETVVKELSQMINRLYLVTPWHRIISTTRLVQQKRQEIYAAAEEARDLRINYRHGS